MIDNFYYARLAYAGFMSQAGAVVPFDSLSDVMKDRWDAAAKAVMEETVNVPYNDPDHPGD